VEECLIYFRQAVTNPSSVPPWSEWWAQNVAKVEQVFSLLDYVRLKHRRLLGARQILQNSGELPEDYRPPSALVTGSCSQCGERTTRNGGSEGGTITCPICGPIGTYSAREASAAE